jgi:hypothetical protein
MSLRVAEIDVRGHLPRPATFLNDLRERMMTAIRLLEKP